MQLHPNWHVFLVCRVNEEIRSSGIVVFYRDDRYNQGGLQVPNSIPPTLLPVMGGDREGWPIIRQMLFTGPLRKG